MFTKDRHLNNQNANTVRTTHKKFAYNS